MSALVPQEFHQQFLHQFETMLMEQSLNSAQLELYAYYEILTSQPHALKIIVDQQNYDVNMLSINLPLSMAVRPFQLALMVPSAGCVRILLAHPKINLSLHMLNTDNRWMTGLSMANKMYVNAVDANHAVNKKNAVCNIRHLLGHDDIDIHTIFTEVCIYQFITSSIAINLIPGAKCRATGGFGFGQHS